MFKCYPALDVDPHIVKYLLSLAIMIKYISPNFQTVVYCLLHRQGSDIYMQIFVMLVPFGAALLDNILK